MIAFTVLGSGSRGNATFVRLGDRGVLLDCGLSMRATRQRLAARAIAEDAVTDVLVTHFDTDHFNAGWSRTLSRSKVTVHLHERHRSLAVRRGVDGACMRLFRDEPFEIGAATVEPLLLAHDALGSVGYVIEHDGCRLGWATDLGRVPKSLLRHFRNLHALGIESNYDPQMQLRSGRPERLVRRIMSGRGHLSNDQALEAVQAIARTSPLECIAALHLSEQCNDPRLVRRGFEVGAAHLLEQLTVTHQREPSPLLAPAGGGVLSQAGLFGG